MELNVEIIILLVVNLISIGIWVGGVSSFKRHINYRLDRLEDKQDKHNQLIERMTKVEESTKSAHHRIDELTTQKR